MSSTKVTSGASAGDINGDGYVDLILGHQGDPNSQSDAGESYVVFGQAGGFDTSFDLASLAGGDGSTGFVINGAAEHDRSGTSVASAGDVNGDGIDDLIIGAWRADPNGNSSAGASYVVFGKEDGFDANFDLASLATGDGSAGFVINGIAEQDKSGVSVASAGDVNGDGDDLIIADAADPINSSNAGVACCSANAPMIRMVN